MAAAPFPLYPVARWALSSAAEDSEVRELELDDCGLEWV